MLPSSVIFWFVRSLARSQEKCSSYALRRGRTWLSASKSKQSLVPLKAPHNNSAVVRGVSIVTSTRRCLDSHHKAIRSLDTAVMSHLISAGRTWSGWLWELVFSTCDPAQKSNPTSVKARVVVATLVIKEKLVRPHANSRSFPRNGRSQSAERE